MIKRTKRLLELEEEKSSSFEVLPAHSKKRSVPVIRNKAKSDFKISKSQRNTNIDLQNVLDESELANSLSN